MRIAKGPNSTYLRKKQLNRLEGELDLLNQQHTDIYIYFSFVFISWRLITLQYCSGFCHTLTWISHGFTCVPHPDLPTPSPSIPSLWVFQCTSPEHLSHASNLGWWSASPLIVYLFQCCSLRTSHPHLLPQSLKVCLYICVSFSVLHIGLSLPSF